MDLVLPADWGGAIEALETAFPGNRDRVAKFFDFVKQVAFWQVAAMRGMPAEQIDPVLFTDGLRSVKPVLDEFFDDVRLEGVLALYWSYLGQPPWKLRFQDLALPLFA
ncbi:hypothetical protein [Nocardia nepalensis]|uniref:hypothetical protein n=1 Tax=Nocardia nepalensis TaxID=3375448 RepID=UPI003B66D731